MRNGERLASLPWALLLIWWGVLEIFPGRPAGVGVLGVGLILLGVNAVRVLRGGALCRFSVVIGAVMLVLGALSLVQPILDLPFNLQTFPALLIACGVTMLALEVLPLSRLHAKTR